MKKTLARKGLCLILGAVILLLSCLVFGGCSAEKYLEEGNFEKAYERASKDGNKALQEEILWKSALYGALHSYDSSLNSSDVVCGAYYLIFIEYDAIVGERLAQFVVLEYEDVLSIIKEGYRYLKYELYSGYGSCWEYEGHDDGLWYETRDANHTYNFELESCFSSIENDIDISYVVKHGRKFTDAEIKEVENMQIDEYESVNYVANKDAIIENVSFVVKETTVDVREALQGKWDMNRAYTFADWVCYIEADTYRALYEDAQGNPALNVVSEGTIKIEDKRVVLKNKSGATDDELLYRVHRGYLIVLRKESSKSYRVVTKMNQSIESAG